MAKEKIYTKAGYEALLSEMKALEEAPRWEPARKLGEAVESEGILRLQLPVGRPMPRKIELVIR